MEATYNISCLVGSETVDAVLVLPDDDKYIVRLTYYVRIISAEVDNYFYALFELRKQAERENIKIFCNGCRKDVYPSPMILDMGDADKAYKLSMGQKAVINNLVDIFEPCDPNEYASIEEQLSYYNIWVKSVSAN